MTFRILLTLFSISNYTENKIKTQLKSKKRMLPLRKHSVIFIYSNDLDILAPLHLLLNNYKLEYKYDYKHDDLR